ncbi:MAG TPA: hypothetical protein VGK16_06080 [Candidatus Limnocylindrales bacterium]
MRTPSLIRAALAVSVCLAAAGCGASPARTDSSARPTPAAATPFAPSPAAPTQVPTAVAPPTAGSAATGEPGAFEPPAPLCPAPPAVDPPTLTVAAGAGASRPADVLPGGVWTCSTSAQFDGPVPEPAAPVEAAPGDSLAFTIEDGWQILAWSGFDHPRVGDAANIFPETVMPAGTGSILVPITRTGDSTVTVTITAMRADRRVMADMTAVAWVHTP